MFTREALLGQEFSKPRETVVFSATRHKIKTWFFRLGKRSTHLLLNLVIAVAILVGGALVLPEAYYRFFPADTAPVVNLEAQAETQTNTIPVEEKYIPPQDETLPEGSWLVIPRIGVRTPLRETENPDEALNQGIWQAPGYGEPGDTDQPMIVAGHRFGWQWWWQSDYWKYNSFYLLPQLEPGDRVEVIADQRKWVYEIYAVEEGEDISDYNADMILYTCKFLNSPVRFFKYAKLIDPTKSTQVVS